MSCMMSNHLFSFLRLSLATLTIVVALASIGWTQERRVALVIGIDDYAQIRRLDNAVEDARAVAERLRDPRLGFEVIGPILNPTRDEMIKARDELEQRLRGADVGLLFFAGHAVEVNGRNILLPADMPRVETARQVEARGVLLADILNEMQDLAPRIIAFLDACRDNPLYDATRGGTPTVGSLGGLTGRGLEPIHPPTRGGRFVVFAAQPGAIAFDRLPGDAPKANGLFTRYLLRALDSPTRPIAHLMTDVRDQVAAAALRAGRRQVPHIDDRMIGSGQFLLASALARPPEGSASSPPSPAIARPDSGLQNLVPTARPAGTRWPEAVERTLMIPLEPRHDNKLLGRLNVHITSWIAPPGSAFRGVLVSKVYPRGPADRAGLQDYDIIIALDGTAVNTVRDFIRILATYSPGQQVAVSTVRLVAHEQQFIDRLRNNAAAGDLDSIKALATLYENGLIISNDGLQTGKRPTEAFKLHQQAANLGDPQAVGRLAVAYRDGNGTDIDRVKALALFRQAADSGDTDSMVALARLLFQERSKFEEAINWLNSAASDNNAEAMRELFFLYQYGAHGTERNLPLAFRWRLRALEAGNCEDCATEIINLLQDSSWQGHKDYGQAEKALRIAAQRKAIPVLRALAEGIEKGLFGRAQLDESVILLEDAVKASGNGSISAAKSLARLRRSSDAPIRDLTKAEHAVVAGLDLLKDVKPDDEDGWPMHRIDLLFQLAKLSESKALGPEAQRYLSHAREDLPNDWKINRMRISIQCGSVGGAPFDVYVWDWSKPYDMVAEQLRWVERARGCSVPADVYTVFQNTFREAKEQKVSFMEHAARKIGGPQPVPNSSDPRPSSHLIFFDWNSSTLTDHWRSKIAEAAKGWTTRQRPMRVVGHTDLSQSDDRAMILGRQRADAVAAELVRLGVPKDKISASSVGKQRPLVPTGAGAREPQNRRVEIIVE